MATTTTNPTKSPAAPKDKKAPVAMVTRMTESLKRAALQGKLTADELDTISNLSLALKTFVSV